MTSRDKKKEEKNKKTRKQHTLFYKLLSFILIIMSVFTIGYTVYQEIVSVKVLIPVALVLAVIVFLITKILTKKRLKKWIKNIFSFLSFILILIEIIYLIFGTSSLKLLSNITDTGYRVETFGVYVLNTSSYNELNDLDSKKLNYLSTNDDKNIKAALKKINQKIKVSYDYEEELNSLVDSLINGDVDSILMSTNYEDLIREEMEEKYNQIRLIKKIDIVDVVNTIKSDVDITKDPFAIYLSGIDTSGNVASKARSDVNIILAVNPKTNNILIVSTPRDYYITLKTKNKKDKLTHSGLYGVEESLASLSMLYDVDIDYYARVNFTSFIKIVNALGGINVNVEGKFCEQNSKRSKKEGDLICLNKGNQTLNGEQALAYARNRHAFNGGDRSRGEHQMEILKAIINKALSPKIITNYSSLIDALEGKVSTNITTSEMYKFAKKEIGNKRAWNFVTISATGKDSSGVCYATGSGKAYVMEPDKDSIHKIKMSFDRLFDGESDIEFVEETTTTTKKSN